MDALKVKQGIAILAVSDVKRARTFYDAAFNWKVVVEADDFVEYAVRDGFAVALNSPEKLESITGVKPTPLDPDGFTGNELYLEVDDLRAAMTRVESAGGRLIRQAEKMDWGYEITYYRDTEGNLIVLSQKLAA